MIIITIVVGHDYYDNNNNNDDCNDLDSILTSIYTAVLVVRYYVYFASLLFSFLLLVLVLQYIFFIHNKSGCTFMATY